MSAAAPVQALSLPAMALFELAHPQKADAHKQFFEHSPENRESCAAMDYSVSSSLLWLDQGVGRSFDYGLSIEKCAYSVAALVSVVVVCLPHAHRRLSMAGCP